MTDNLIAYTRRSFVRTLSMGAGLAGVSGGAASSLMQSALGQTSDRKLGIALVGLGGYAGGQLGPALLETKNIYLAGIVTGSPEKVPEWRSMYNVPEKNIYSYDTFDRIADNPDIDAVYIVLPNSMHHEYTLRALRAGKHVMCEKPMAVSVREAEEMIDAAEQAGRKLGVGYRLHYEPYNREMARLGQKQVMGPVKFVEASFGFKIGDPTQWRLRKALAGGGALMDVGIYAIQGARYVTGEEPHTVVAREVKTDPVKFAEVDEIIMWHLEFPSGAVASSVTSYASGVNRLYASAENGWFEVEPAYSYGGIKGRTSKGEMSFPQVNQQALHMDDFALSVMNDTPVQTPGEEGLRDMHVIEAIYRSIRTGKAEKIGQV